VTYPGGVTLELLAKGKVREIYDLGDDLLMVASDRISTYDVVHPTPIPDKGKVLTALSVVWFGLTADVVPNHLISATDGVPDDVRGRALRVTRLRMLPVELRLHPPFSRHGDRCHIERAIGGECKSMGDEAQCLCQVLERSRRETGGGTHGQIALTFFN